MHLENVKADVAVLIDVRMEAWCLEGDLRRLVWVARGELERQLEGEPLVTLPMAAGGEPSTLVRAGAGERRSGVRFKTRPKAALWLAVRRPREQAAAAKRGARARARAAVGARGQAKIPCSRRP